MINGHPPTPKGNDERELERTQRIVTQGLQADERRKQLIVSLYGGGMTQVEIAARLTRASVGAGGDPIGEDAVQKLVARNRRKATR